MEDIIWDTLFKHPTFNWWLQKNPLFKFIIILIIGIILGVVLKNVISFSFKLESLFWTYSTIAQTMAGLLSISAVFVIYLLTRISEELRSIRRTIYNSIKYSSELSTLKGWSNVRDFENILDSYIDHENIIDFAKKIIKKIRFFIRTTTKELAKESVERVKKQLTLLKQHIKRYDKLMNQRDKILSNLRHNFYWIIFTIAIALLIVPFGEYSYNLDFPEIGIINIAIITIVFLSCYAIVSLAYSISKTWRIIQ